MAAIDYDSELKRAGAHATHGWRRLAHLAQRHVLGAVGLFIMITFVWVAASADIIGRYEQVYCSTIGAEFAHVSDTEERLWLQDQVQDGLGQRDDALEQQGRFAQPVEC